LFRPEIKRKRGFISRRGAGVLASLTVFFAQRKGEKELGGERRIQYAGGVSRKDAKK
jgi:hypothetical protein